ncbi:MAG: DUF2147 domain-containing protein [Beijerinckiaceae bacterium]
MYGLRLACFVSIFLPGEALSLPLGQWQRGDGNTRVRIERCGKALCAINTWVNDTSQGEMVGHRLEMNVAPSGERRLVGSAFDPQRDRSYGITIDYSPDRMSTRGCLLGVLCKTVNWTRIQ